MITFLAAALFLSHQKPVLTLDVKSGEMLSGIRHFRVSVEADDPVTQVEFYVNNELRDSDSSVPYDFNLDTVDQSDGDLQLTFAAYTNRGDSAKSQVDVKIDNGVAEGAAPHVAKGIDYLSSNNWDSALLQGRIALKISPENNQARMVMARAYLGKGVLDKAEKYAQDWHTSEPTSSEAVELLSGIDVRRAFSTLSHGGADRATALNDIQNALKSAIVARQDLMQSKLDAIGKPNDDNVVSYVDIALAAGRLNLAIKALTPTAFEHLDRNDLTNRLAYAQLMSGDVSGALQTLKQVQRLAKMDAYGYALIAVASSLAHQDNDAGRNIVNAAAMDPNDAGVLTAQAYLAARAGKSADLQKAVTALATTAPSLSETNYYLSLLGNTQGNFEDARKYFEETLFIDPLSVEAYVLEGNNYLGFAVASKKGSDDQAFRAKSAQAMYNVALAVRPESYHALAGLALAHMIVAEKDDALKYAIAANKAAPTQPLTLYVMSAAYSMAGDTRNAYEADRTAWHYDSTVLAGRAVPGGLDAWNYYKHYGQMPVMAPPK